jgi:hypothetical protein
MRGGHRNTGRKAIRGTKTGEKARRRVNEIGNSIESKLEINKVRASCDVTELTGQ